MGITKWVLSKGKSTAMWTGSKLGNSIKAVGNDIKEGVLDEVITPIRETREAKKANKAEQESK